MAARTRQRLAQALHAAELEDRIGGRALQCDGAQRVGLHLDQALAFAQGQGLPALRAFLQGCDELAVVRIQAHEAVHPHIVQIENRSAHAYVFWLTGRCPSQAGKHEHRAPGLRIRKAAC
jgi:hypothetical protein